MFQDLAVADLPALGKVLRHCGTQESCSTTADSPCGSNQSFEDAEAVYENMLSDTYRRSSQTSTTTSNGLYSEPGQTLLILDWDDTLFPTTELIDNWGVPSRCDDWDHLQFTESQEYALESWRTALHEYLCTACSLSGRCVIVTNAKRPWVENCVSRFAPSLRPLLFGECTGGPDVVYAREVFDAQPHRKARQNSRFMVPARRRKSDAQEDCNALLKAWKYAAMRQEAAKFYSQYPGQTWKNIISIGDMHHEYHALQDLAFRRCGPAGENLRTKAVVVPEQQSITSLTLELRIWQLLLPVLVCVDGDVDLNLGLYPHGERQRALSGDLCMPSLVGSIPPCDATDEEAHLMLDELAQKVHDHLSH